jgi:hypothetical protein
MASFPYPPVSLSLQHYADAVEFQVSLASIGVGSIAFGASRAIVGTQVVRCSIGLWGGWIEFLGLT